MASERADPLVVQAQLTGYDSKALKASPSGLFAGAYFFQPLRGRHQLLNALRFNVDNRVAIWSNLNEIHSEPAKYSGVILVEADFRRNNTVLRKALISRLFVDARNRPSKDEIVTAGKRILRSS